MYITCIHLITWANKSNQQGSIVLYEIMLNCSSNTYQQMASMQEIRKFEWNSSNRKLFPSQSLVEYEILTHICSFLPAQNHAFVDNGSGRHNAVEQELQNWVRQAVLGTSDSLGYVRQSQVRQIIFRTSHTWKLVLGKSVTRNQSLESVSCQELGVLGKSSTRNQSFGSVIYQELSQPSLCIAF